MDRGKKIVSILKNILLNIEFIILFLCKKKEHKKKYFIIIGLFFLIVYINILPNKIFNNPTSTVIESKEGILIGAKISEDGQWCFPSVDTLNDKYKKCVILFEDEYFYYHIGFNPVSIFKSIIGNINTGKIIRGGSTITQQVVRMMRGNKKRNFYEKIIELVLATRIEFKYSKEKILGLYASNAPFGGNVVGLGAASWRYFGVSQDKLSWAECATLAVLPNSPSLIHPAKNRDRLLKKRNRLLLKLKERNVIDSVTYNLSLLEELPDKPYPIPQYAPHLLSRLNFKNKGKLIKTSIDYILQKKTNEIIKKHYDILKQNHIYNIATIVVDVETKKVLCYIGNSPTTKEHQKDVDIIQSPRSTGSMLKPLLFSCMFDDGELLPETLVIDVPVYINGYIPENSNKDYTGAISAKLALSRSLNIPSVKLLQEYGLERFKHKISQFGLKHINKSGNYYGLPLILGGAESSLWDLIKVYTSLSSTLNHYLDNSSGYFRNEYNDPILIEDQKYDLGKLSLEKTILGAGSIYSVLEAMKEVNRPDDNSQSWKYYNSSKEIAWKTGTSFGGKDAWSIGVTKKYVVGVWVGNADGEGRPDLTGTSSAGPILFDIFDILPKTKWFNIPYDDMEEVEVCINSGYIASEICEKKKIYVPSNGIKFNVCPYHKIVHLDNDMKHQVNTHCEFISNIKSVPWFVLPNSIEYYFSKNNMNYRKLPPFKKECIIENKNVIDLIFPEKRSKIILTKNFKGNINEVVFKAIHNDPKASIFWYLDDKYITETTNFHEIIVLPKVGTHKVTIMDDKGNSVSNYVDIDTT